MCLIELVEGVERFFVAWEEIENLSVILDGFVFCIDLLFEDDRRLTQDVAAFFVGRSVLQFNAVIIAQSLPIFGLFVERFERRDAVHIVGKIVENFAIILDSRFRAIEAIAVNRRHLAQNADFFVSRPDFGFAIEDIE